MRIKNPFLDLTRFETALWRLSVLMITFAFALSRFEDVLTLIAALIGVTALIFVAKGYVLGQILTIVFAVFYGVISLHFRYYGEALTYLGMSAPSAAAAAVAWKRHPYAKTKEVEIHRLTARQKARIPLLCLIVTGVFYGLLKLLGNASLFVSTLSIATSFLASCLTFYRSPYYAIAYAFNDVVVVILWIIAARTDPSCLPMVVCFVMFLINDLYGFISWKRMLRRQSA